MIQKKKMALSLSLAMILFAGCGTIVDEGTEDTDKGKRDINQPADNATNSAPTATPQTITLDEDGSKVITFAGMDQDDDTLTFEVVTNPANGTINGATYTPDANFFGNDSFTFKANDGTVDSNEATVSITVNSISDAPIATPQSVTLDEDTNTTITLAGTDAENDALTYTVATEPTNGTFDGTTYTPNANFNGTDSFTFIANDGDLNSTPATISITIDSVNDAPTVNAGDDGNITEGDSFSPAEINATDIDGYIVNTDTVWKENETIITFPKADFTVGEHILTVTVTDNEGLDANDTLTLTVKPPCTPLPATGQTTSYYANDDGNLTKGTARSFTRDDTNETVTDNVTGLMWQDNAGNGLKSFDEAGEYCTGLTLGGYEEWRLPVIKELVYLVDRSKDALAINPVFQNTGRYYWSSTMKANSTFNVWYARFSDGASGTIGKSYTLNVRCVRETE